MDKNSFGVAVAVSSTGKLNRKIKLVGWIDKNIFANLYK